MSSSSHSDIASTLVRLALRKIEQDKVDEANLISLALFSEFPGNATVVWIFGITAQSRDNIVASAEKLFDINPEHTLNLYNTPDFEVSNSDVKTATRNVEQKYYNLLFYSLFIVMHILCLFLFIKGTGWINCLVVLSVTWLALLLLITRNVIREYLWSQVQEKISKELNDIGVDYWMLLLITTKNLLPTLFGKRIRPEPYTLSDQKIVEITRDSHTHISLIKQVFDLVQSINSLAVRRSTKNLFNLFDISHSIRQSLFILDQLNSCKFSIEEGWRLVRDIEENQIDAASIHNILQQHLEQNFNKAKKVIILFCDEAKCTPFGVFLHFVAIHSYLDKILYVKNIHQSYEPSNWKLAVSMYEDLQQASKSIDNTIIAVTEVTELRVLASEKLSEVMGWLNRLEEDLASESIDFKIDDFLLKLADGRERVKAMMSLQPCPDSYSHIIAESHQWCEGLEEAYRQFHKRRELIGAITDLEISVDVQMRQIAFEIKRIEIELHFTFDISTDSLEQQSVLLEDLKSQYNDYNEITLLNKLERLKSIQEDVEKVKRLFEEAKLIYGIVIDYERLGELLNTLLRLGKKSKLAEDTWINKVQEAKNAISKLRRIGVKKESKLRLIREHYSFARDIFDKNAVSLITLITNGVGKLRQEIGIIKQTLRGWEYLDSPELETVVRQLRALQSALKNANNSDIDERALYSIEQEFLSYLHAVKSNKEYLEQLQFLKDQCKYIRWRVSGIKLKSGNTLDGSAKSILQEIERCIVSAQTNQTFSVIKIHLDRADKLLTDIGLSIGYTTNISGDVKGFVQGHNARVNMIFHAGASLERHQLFEMGYLFSILCWKPEPLRNRQKVHAQIVNIISSTHSSSLFPPDILFYLSKDSEVPYVDVKKVIEDTLLTCDSIAGNIRSKTGRKEESLFRIGFNIGFGVNIAMSHQVIDAGAYLGKVLIDLRSYLRSLRYTKDMELIDNTILRMVNQRQWNDVADALRQFRVSFLKKLAEPTKPSK